jgi:hypothetical protein
VIRRRHHAAIRRPDRLDHRRVGFRTKIKSKKYVLVLFRLIEELWNCSSILKKLCGMEIIILKVKYRYYSFCNGPKQYNVYI